MRRRTRGAVASKPRPARAGAGVADTDACLGARHAPHQWLLGAVEGREESTDKPLVAGRRGKKGRRFGRGRQAARGRRADRVHARLSECRRAGAQYRGAIVATQPKHAELTNADALAGVVALTHGASAHLPKRRAAAAAGAVALVVVNDDREFITPGQVEESPIPVLMVREPAMALASASELVLNLEDHTFWSAEESAVPRVWEESEAQTTYPTTAIGQEVWVRDDDNDIQWICGAVEGYAETSK